MMLAYKHVSPKEAEQVEDPKELAGERIAIRLNLKKGFDAYTILQRPHMITHLLWVPTL